MKTGAIMFIAAGIISICNVVIILTSIKRTNAVNEWYEALSRQHKLKEFEKRRMCNSFCKFKESAKTIEELEWKCANCPIAKL